MIPWLWLPCLLVFFSLLSQNNMTRLLKCMWFRFWQHTPNKSNHELPGKFQVIRGWMHSTFMNFPETLRREMALKLVDGISWFFMVFHSFSWSDLSQKFVAIKRQETLAKVLSKVINIQEELCELVSWNFTIIREWSWNLVKYQS